MSFMADHINEMIDTLFEDAEDPGQLTDLIESAVARYVAADAPHADPLRLAALALLRRLDNMTTDAFADGGERTEREALRAALGYGPLDQPRTIGPDVDDQEMCARCGQVMTCGSSVIDVSTTPDMPWATAEWATVHDTCRAAS